MRREAGRSVAEVAGDVEDLRSDHLREIEDGLRPLAAEFLPELIASLQADPNRLFERV
jgi:hypothetical protein